MRAQSLQSCLTLCDPTDCSLTCSSVHGILQTRILEWVAMPSSRIFLTQGSNLGLLNDRQSLYRLSRQGSPLTSIPFLSDVQCLFSVYCILIHTWDWTRLFSSIDLFVTVPSHSLKKFFLIYFWLPWVFVAACDISLVEPSRGYSSLWCMSFPLGWLLLWRSTGSSSRTQ